MTNFDQQQQLFKQHLIDLVNDHDTLMESVTVEEYDNDSTTFIIKFVHVHGGSNIPRL